MSVSLFRDPSIDREWTFLTLLCLRSTVGNGLRADRCCGALEIVHVRAAQLEADDAVRIVPQRGEVDRVSVVPTSNVDIQR